MTELEKYIQTYFGVNKEELSVISSYFKLRTLKKGEHFLKAGRQSDQLAFVQTGIFREYTIINNKEITKWISTKRYFVVDLSAFLFNQPARWNIEALTDCELYVIDKTNYKKIQTEVSGWTELEKMFIAKCFMVLEDRIVQHLSLSAEEHYSRLFSFNKELFNQIPLQYLASMLGMTPETFSRIRKKMSGKIS